MKKEHEEKIIFFFQLLPLIGVWSMTLGMTGFVIYLINLSLQQADVPMAGIGISLVVVPVFWTIAGTFTYLFVGLRRGRKKEGDR